jgi:putative transposase
VEIWERGYVDHRIRDAADYMQHVVYIRQNPVEARLANCAEDYSYCSAHPGFELDVCPQGLKPQLIKSA